MNTSSSLNRLSTYPAVADSPRTPSPSLSPAPSTPSSVELPATGPLRSAAAPLSSRPAETCRSTATIPPLPTSFRNQLSSPGTPLPKTPPVDTAATADASSTALSPSVAVDDNLGPPPENCSTEYSTERFTEHSATRARVVAASSLSLSLSSPSSSFPAVCPSSTSTPAASARRPPKPSRPERGKPLPKQPRPSTKHASPLSSDSESQSSQSPALKGLQMT